MILSYKIPNASKNIPVTKGSNILMLRPSLTLLNKCAITKISKRTMLGGRSFQAIRAVYHFASVISNNEILDKTNKKNTQPFIQEVVDLTLNPNRGVLQHKSALFKHFSNQKFDLPEFYDSYKTITNTPNVRCEPHTSMDFRILNELGILQQYLNVFANQIEWIYATGDTRASNFYHQKQPNVDFWVMTKLDRAMGLGYKCVYQDEKSGMDILSHSTRGSLGVLSYDSNGNNIQVTSKSIEMIDIITFNNNRIRMLEDTMKTDGIDPEIFHSALSNAKNMISDIKDKPYSEVIKLHNNLQDLLWKDFQCDPLFKRSLSFVFIREIINTPTSAREETFSKVFRSHIQDKMYDLNKRQDFIDIYKAMIFAGKAVDSDFLKKIYHLHNNGITLNKHLLPILAELIKHGL